MDPLSVGASIIAVVGTTGKVIKGIRRLKALRNAPRELDDLLDEVSQFEIVIQAIQNASQNAGSELKILIETAQTVLVEFDSLIEYELTEAGASDRVDRWQWTRKSNGVERMRGKLRDVTANVVALVGVNTSTTVHQAFQATNQVLSEQRQFHNQILPAMNLLVQLLEESPSTRAALTGSLGSVRQLTHEPAAPERGTVAKITEIETYQADRAKTNLRSKGLIRVSTTKKLSICDSYCNCKCHIWTSLGASGFFSKLFGRGYIQTAGSIVFGTQCDTELCRAYTAPRISVQYNLPQWLASRMIFIWFTSSPAGSPELLIRIPRVVEHDNAAFKAVRRNNLGELEIALARGDCTPCDVDEYGYSLFELALRQDRWKALQYITINFDSWISSAAENCVGMLWHAALNWDWHIRSKVDLDQRRTVLLKFSSLIDWESHVEMQVLTTLHLIVMGISDLSLDGELQGSTTINQLDKDGRSALWYAVRSGHLDFVGRLLEHGADPNIGEPPLWAATDYWGSYAITKVLLDHGASLDSSLNPNSKNKWLPWPDYFFEHEELAVEELLIRQGIDVNHRAEWCGVGGVTILMRLSGGWYNNIPQRLEQLILSGADIETCDKRGYSALMYAIRAAKEKNFHVLASAGARLNLKTVTGCTILHLAIIHTTFKWAFVNRFCKVVRNLDLTALDIDAENEQGDTAYDLLRLRNGPRWEGYCVDRDVFIYRMADRYGNEEWLREEFEAIETLEKLLHQIQTCQGVPEADQYPPLGKFGSRDPDDKPVPGEWPVC